MPIEIAKITWAPNDPMFPNTPEVSQIVFSVRWKPVWLIRSCPKTIYLSDVLGKLWLSRQLTAAVTN